MRRAIRYRTMKGIKRVKKGGQVYKYLRSNGAPLPADIPEDSPEFAIAVTRAAGGDAPVKTSFPKNSIGNMIERLKADPVWRQKKPGYTKPTEKRLAQIAQKYGTGPMHDLLAEHVRQDLKSFEQGAYNNRLKAWRALCAFSVGEGVCDVNVASSVKMITIKTDGFHTWTPDEISKYRKHWKYGTRERLAFELIYWTAARCVDARRLSRAMVQPDGWIRFTQEKTDGEVEIPFKALPASMKPLKSDFAHLHKALEGHNEMMFILTTFGKPRSQKGLSQWFSERAGIAGLDDHCTAHGLRKARAVRLVELGWSSARVGSWTGHESLGEIERYIRKRDKRRVLEMGDISLQNNN